MSYRFAEVPASDVTDFFAHHAQGSFAQSLPMAGVRSDLGRDIHYVAVYDDDQLVAAAQLSLIPGRVASADITAGPLLDYSDDTLLAYFTSEIRRFVKQLGGVYLTISPYLPYDAAVVASLERLGWSYSGRINAHMVGLRGNIRWIYVKDLTDQTVETYRDAYAKRHRRYIKNHDPRLSVRRLERGELPLFLDIMKHTAERRHFSSRSDDYFYSLFDRFGDGVQFLIAELEEDGAKTPVAGIVFIESNGEVVSFLGGAVVEYANYRGSYLLHDHMIRYAIEQGYARYNFYGIEGKIDDPSSEGYGIYQFKSKFGTGQAVELVGEFVLPIDPVRFKVWRASQTLRSLIGKK